MQIEAVKSQQLQMPLLPQSLLQLQLRQFVFLANLLLHTFMGSAKVLMSQLSLAIVADLHTCNREKREKDVEYQRKREK